MLFSQVHQGPCIFKLELRKNMRSNGHSAYRMKSSLRVPDPSCKFTELGLRAEAKGAENAGITRKHNHESQLFSHFDVMDINARVLQ